MIETQVDRKRGRCWATGRGQRVRGREKRRGEKLTDSSCSPGGSHDEEDDEDDREAARDDVGNVGERAVCMDVGYAALWVYTNRSD